MKRATREVQTTFKTRMKGDTPDGMIIEGYFLLYEDETELMPNVREILTRGAADGSLEGDVKALWNHSAQHVLGRTKSGSLELRSDEKGLYGRITLPNTSYGRDLHALVTRGDVDQASFGFTPVDETVEELENGGMRWRINKLDLHEISVVTFPAYENTSVQARAKQVEQYKRRAFEQKRQKLKNRLEGDKPC
ncbi:HK97 family phage prohead protease [Shouchella lonarensis]|uniref:Prohead serine protease domain-containing protein n=1 Tax=Shouchella lonarensis TaxID=1464122 RepID=A0A1G6IHU2_9BACI|nr:HK97 family phage prohead protease [Shouchella lonarensis]SDC05963.1 hypothetical protein SAMN05421737_10567 [Shouchella lonarensis]